MCKAVEEFSEKIAEERAEETRLNTIFETIETLKKSLKKSEDEVMTLMEISDTDRAILIKRF